MLHACQLARFVRGENRSVLKTISGSFKQISCILHPCVLTEFSNEHRKFQYLSHNFKTLQQNYMRLIKNRDQ